MFTFEIKCIIWDLKWLMGKLWTSTEHWKLLWYFHKHKVKRLQQGKTFIHEAILVNGETTQCHWQEVPFFPPIGGNVCSLKYLALKFTYASVSLCKCEHFVCCITRYLLSAVHGSYTCFVCAVLYLSYGHKSGALGIMSYCIYRYKSW